MTTHLTFVHALSPLHAGTGQGSGNIDLPIAREKATNLPFFPGSSLKGALRNQCEGKYCEQIFGPDLSNTPDNDGYSSAVQISDQRLLLFPVRSLAGTFAWTTSPHALYRLARDSREVQLTDPTPDVPVVEGQGHCLVSSKESQLTISGKHKKLVYIEDLDLQIDDKEKGAADRWAEWLGKLIFSGDTIWQNSLKARLCIVHDDIFNFLVDTATEITARIKLKEGTKTVQDGGLWYEEALPTETVLSGLLLVSKTRNGNPPLLPDRVFSELEKLTEKTIQLGGKATVGRGMCHVQFTPATKTAAQTKGA
jgi:CRISPR-associated protein Cmr4